MPVASPPILPHLLFENPWPLGSACAAIAIALFWIARQSGRSRPRMAAMSFVVAAVAVFVAASAVTTTRERLIDETTAMIHSTAPLNMSDFKARVDANVVLQGPEGETWRTGTQLFDSLDMAMTNYLIEGQAVLDVQVETRGQDRAVALVDVRTDGKTGRVVTRWLLTWAKQGDGAWKVVAVQWLDSPHMIGLKANRQFLP